MSKTRAEWWESVKPFHEAGRMARRDGLPLTLNSAIVTEAARASWAKGWEYEDGFIKVLAAREAEACAKQNAIMERRRLHDATYATVADALSRLGIDLYQLRDYLAGLPEDDE